MGVVGLLLVGVLGSAWAKPHPVTVYVDCAAAPGGTGSRTAPFATITAALPAAKTLSATKRVTVDVAEGVCGSETLPMVLDFPVHVRGAREPVLDDSGRPTGEALRDTLVTWTPPTSGPNTAFQPTFFDVTTTKGAEVSHLTIDGKRPPGGNTFTPGNPGPTGLRFRPGAAYDVKAVRLERMETAIRSDGASGRVRESYLSDVNSPFVIQGGVPGAARPTGAEVVLRHNRIDAFRLYGMVAFAGTPDGGGTHLDLVVEDNEFSTPYTRTGPTNPAGLRVATSAMTGRYGVVRARYARNEIRGPVPYPVMILGSTAQRLTNTPPPTGELYLSFEDNVYDEAASQGTSLITYTHARATELPCELNPPTTPSCSGLGGAGWWAYLAGSTYDIEHTGELDDVAIDHPDLDPMTGVPLDNLLLMNGDEIDHGTFVAIP